MKKTIYIIVVLALVAAGVFLGWLYGSKQQTAPTGNQNQNQTGQTASSTEPTAVDLEIEKHRNLIRLAAPQPDEKVSSPLTLSGEARGYWYFEASFPAKLYDGAGNLLAATPAQAQSEWMTENFVPFKAILEFVAPTTSAGYLVLEKDNPSGLPENADELKIPVKF